MKARPASPRRRAARRPACRRSSSSGGVPARGRGRWAGQGNRPGRHRRVGGQHRASASRCWQWRSMRRCRVLSPRSSRKASCGTSPRRSCPSGPAGGCAGPLGTRRPPPPRRSRRHGRPGTWWPSARPRRHRAAAAFAGRGAVGVVHHQQRTWRPWPPRHGGDVHQAHVRVGRGLQVDELRARAAWPRPAHSGRSCRHGCTRTPNSPMPWCRKA
jgi:hypothetical protein